ncbi:hypothetical protein [Sphingomonas sp. TDK1]|uniref:hypothetical protein n=1 Tax=Sphingomonas sp. TDK1 TaxID=453247 RepID=UPI0007D90F25|nr:hypothetical protein [Sphingomonas sp. TDK1]OAN57256.1 hypothetical protein A7X12_08570 [Sphingomonas sp. TDK1]
MSRRPVLWGVGMGLILALLLAPWTGTALGRLHKARLARDREVATLAAPQVMAPLLGPGQSVPPPGIAAVRARIEQRARAGGVLIEDAQPIPAPAPLVAIRLRVSGPEKAVVALADSIERDQPLLRFRVWRLVPAEGGGVRLSGELVGATR